MSGICFWKANTKGSKKVPTKKVYTNSVKYLIRFRKFKKVPKNLRKYCKLTKILKNAKKYH